MNRLFILLILAVPYSAAPDITVADFEGSDYAGWTATGTAFGSSPAGGAIGGQQAVSGFAGNGLVNSFLGGDGAKGTLTSPEFTIENDWLNFLSGGGHHPDSAYVGLLVGSERIRSQWGNNSEALMQKSWWVGDLTGQQAAIEIADQASGDWGHILADHFVQSDNNMALKETFRPQFHFTAENYWLNDPNGLVYYKGEYHLFFQHNPYGIEWGNMTWGHAVSRDLVHWEHLPHAIYPESGRDGCPAYSGNAFVDWDNTAGFQTGDEEVLVAAWTTAGCGQRIAYSNDRGRSWTKYEGNPVIPQAGDMRDPHVFWHEPTQKWVMDIYWNDGTRKAHFYNSDDLKTWQYTGSIGEFFECTNMFELALDGNPDRKKWFLFGADGAYMIGEFDGLTFVKESGKFPLDWGGNFYASQIYSDTPQEDGRTILITWMRGAAFNTLGMPFNQAMGFPMELRYVTTPEGPRIVKNPVREIELLRRQTHSFTDQTVSPGANLLQGIGAELLDIHAEFEIADGTEFGFRIKGANTISYNVADQLAGVAGPDLANRTADLAVPENSRMKIRILVDRGTLETFFNDGQRSFTHFFTADPGNETMEIFSTGGNTGLISMDVYELGSGWDYREDPVTRVIEPSVQRADKNPIRVMGNSVAVNAAGVSRMQIIDTRGRVIDRKNVEGAERYSTAGLGKGLYIVRLKTVNLVSSKKLTVW